MFRTVNLQKHDQINLISKGMRQLLLGIVLIQMLRSFNFYEVNDSLECHSLIHCLFFDRHFTEGPLLDPKVNWFGAAVSRESYIVYENNSFFHNVTSMNT